MSTRRTIAAAALLAASMGVAVGPAAASEVDRAAEPGPFAMFGDLVVARPSGVAMTAVGTATFVASLPFTAAGGNVKEAGEQLVVGPAKETFVRCLGCRRSGYRSEYDDVE